VIFAPSFHEINQNNTHFNGIRGKWQHVASGWECVALRSVFSLSETGLIKIIDLHYPGSNQIIKNAIVYSEKI